MSSAPKMKDLTWDQGLVDVFDQATEPLQAFMQVMEDVPGDSVPDEGHPRLCAKVLGALLDHQRRVFAQAVGCVDDQVGKIILNAHNFRRENREERIAGQYCLARIAGQGGQS